MLKKINTLLFISTIICIVLLANTASAKQLYQVGTDHLNIHSSPNHFADVVGQLSYGDHITIFEEKYGWMQTYYGGKKVWVASQYLINSENVHLNENDASKDKVKIIANNVRLRSGPGLNYHTIGYTNSGKTFDLVEINQDWLKIVQADGTTAWIASWLTDYNTEQHKLTTANSAITKTNDQLNGINIVLDPGHGGQDTASISLNNKFEKDYTLTTVKIIADKLRQSGAEVILTRTNDTSLSLENRVKISHAHLTDAFISIHYDAFETEDTHGVSTHYYGSHGSLKLAQTIQNELSAYTGLKNRGLVNSPFHVLRSNEHLAVLIELGFLTNDNDLAKIENEQHAHLVAEAINRALIKYFN